jgi:nicotinate phosphoribosyltransferase
VSAPDTPASDLALFTDLYELTMAQAYYAEEMTAPAVFDLFVRTLPEERNFLIAAGLDEVLDYLEGLRFSAEALAYLESLSLFSPEFLDRLNGFRFTGSVRAVPDGTVVFAGEPLLEVMAPLPEAQLVETYLLNQVTFQTLIASKAVRSVLAAQGRPVVDFAQRRTHGWDAGVKAARACYLVGFASTSSVLAGQRYGIPVTGTMGHSYIQAHDSEREAFRAFLRQYPSTVLLVDTYDTIGGVREVIRLAEELGDDFKVGAVRLDSGDLHALAREARVLLDAAGLERVGIVASGGLEERAIARFVASEAPISVFAVGTQVGISADEPALDSVYKLVEYAGRGRAKLSTAKATWPGRKQVFRQYVDDRAERDILGLVDEPLDGTPLLMEVMREGRRVARDDAGLEAARTRVRAGLETLPERLLTLEAAGAPYAIEISSAVVEGRERVRRGLVERDR